jgi:hypothetical protein
MDVDEQGAPEEADEAYRAVELALCRIPDVTAARIVADAAGRPIEVHILASPAKHAKQVVRDVQSVAMATFGIDFDRRIISVVQLDRLPGDPEGAAELARRVNGTDATSSRIVIDAVHATRAGMHYSAQVTLRRDDDVAVGLTEGVLVSNAPHRLIAAATLSALREFEPAADRAEVETVMLVRLGDRQAAVASIVFAVPPYEEVIAGSAVVRAGGEAEAVVRAVLSATNRRLARLTGH